MSDDQGPKGPPADGPMNSEQRDASHEDGRETAFAAEQRRGRERMIGMWRAAVRGVTEAAQRAAASNDIQVGPGPASAPAEADDASAPAAEPTWVLPPTRAPGSGN